MSLNRLRTLKADVLQVDDLVELFVFAKNVKAEFEVRKISVPDYIEDGIRTLDREISVRSADDLERRLAEAKQRRLALTPRSERLKDLDAEIAELQAQKAKI